MSETFPPVGAIDLSAVEPHIALGALDGRYRSVVAPLVNHLSEASLNRARVFVEVEWLIHLLDKKVLPGAPELTEADRTYLRAITAEFDGAAVAALAEIEAETRHDVKAVEYYLKEKLDAATDALPGSVLPSLHEVVHIFCTSEDINNLAYALIIKSAVEQSWLPLATAFVNDLRERATQAAQIPMLSRTHGQPATPTTLGKELAVFAHRLGRQLKRVATTEYLGKINGATGTFSAHVTALPQVDWREISRSFVVDVLGLQWNPLTTQIESHDWQAELYADVARFNRIAHNFATDAWTYISLGFFHQNLAAQGSTGSSTMPHKVNPIRFENAEANLEISCALLDVLAQTLVTSRMQRDLTDSSTQRNVGSALGHSYLALDNLRKGLAGVDFDAAKMAADLDENWEVLGEAIQQTMRVASIAGATGMENPYERLKELTRGNRVTEEQLREFIISLKIPAEYEARLVALTPGTYIGIAPQLLENLPKLETQPS
ncbi:adenylosuccinate lyase [Gleimia sp. 6138-11-ORH1]|uniref:adenylosuccinate lyase n=1 Tax=Gleimia sp. 6138-11-ORH1 TaxID=2973937 RepID=UPI002167E1EB|nr:adenylosuccinate lyase [Gleimia sp. 6138-11-ORH1]MCS4484972.1 adenylosuccinate lyase [Gleimia sp. 6138-11-ORH1]